MKKKRERLKQAKEKERKGERKKEKRDFEENVELKEGRGTKSKIPLIKM